MLNATKIGWQNRKNHHINELENATKTKKKNEIPTEKRKEKKENSNRKVENVCDVLIKNNQTQETSTNWMGKIYMIFLRASLSDTLLKWQKHARILCSNNLKLKGKKKQKWKAIFIHGYFFLCSASHFEPLNYCFRPKCQDESLCNKYDY